jgi:hypothetical protein
MLYPRMPTKPPAPKDPPAAAEEPHITVIGSACASASIAPAPTR